MSKNRKSLLPTFADLAATCPSWQEWGSEETCEAVVEFLQSRVDRLREMERFDNHWTLYAVALVMAHHDRHIDLKSSGVDFLTLMGNIKNGYRREAKRLMQHEIEHASRWLDAYHAANKR